MSITAEFTSRPRFGMDDGLIRLRASKLVPDRRSLGALPDVEPEWVCARILLEFSETVEEGLRICTDLADVSPLADE